MRLRSDLVTTVVIASVLVLVGAIGPLSTGTGVAQGWSDEGVILAPDPDAAPQPIEDPDCRCRRPSVPWLDGACPALDPELVRARYRGLLRSLFGTGPTSADAEVAEVTRTLRRWPLAARRGALEDLLADASIRDTAVAASAIPQIAERWGLPEAALRDAASFARERLLMLYRDEGRLEPEAFRCLLQRLRLHFRPPRPGTTERRDRRPRPRRRGPRVEAPEGPSDDVSRPRARRPTGWTPRPDAGGSRRARRRPRGPSRGHARTPTAAAPRRTWACDRRGRDR